MSIICPTVTCQSEDLLEYRLQMEKVEFAPRMQVDLMDGDFTPTKSPDINDVWFFENKLTDLHLMYKNPSDALNRIIDLSPNLLIIHSEANVDIPTFAGAIKTAGIKFGLALLQQTDPQTILDFMEYLDHVLIFSGDLGRFGGEADLNLLKKVKQLRDFKPSLEIGWDGGITENNVIKLRDGGVDVLNVGGYIQNASNPIENYHKLTNLVQS